MCGIAGIISEGGISEVDIWVMTDCLRHRGPDAGSTYINDQHTVALGHRRLSIIDLNERANQPFTSANGRYVIVFNGEIYNFQSLRQSLSAAGVSFKTTSDTEVLLEAFSAWGPKAISSLEGMFSLAIYDTNTGCVTLVRDRLGKKPLFYYSDDSVFAFASEIKSLTTLPYIKSKLRIRQQSISTFLHLGYVAEPSTIYENVSKLPAGHIGVVKKLGDVEILPYWRLSNIHIDHSITNPLRAKQSLRKLINRAVEKRLMSDVPLGVFLSGGTDSSLVTAVAASKFQGDLKTFSIGFEESKFDESGYAEQVARHLNTRHKTFVLPENKAIKILEQYLHHFDEPFADTSAIPTMLVSELAKREVKVALTGDGGDELFLGYGSYTWANRLGNRFWRYGKKPLAIAFNLMHKPQFKRVAKLVNTSQSFNLRSHIFSQEQYFFSEAEIQNHVLKDNVNFQPFIYDESFLANGELTEAEKQAVFDIQYYLKDDLLVKVDRASMYYGLECRCPLLDNDVVEFALHLDPSLKIRNGDTKWLLKQLLSDYLPMALVNRPKWGFSIPLSKWLKNDLRYLMDYLSAENVNKTNVFNHDYIRGLITRFENGEDYLYNRLWVAIVLQRFLLHNG